MGWVVVPRAKWDPDWPSSLHLFQYVPMVTKGVAKWREHNHPGAAGHASTYPLGFCKVPSKLLGTPDR